MTVWICVVQFPTKVEAKLTMIHWIPTQLRMNVRYREGIRMRDTGE
jgi:hypothetical protein